MRAINTYGYADQEYFWFSSLRLGSGGQPLHDSYNGGWVLIKSIDEDIGNSTVPVQAICLLFTE